MWGTGDGSDASRWGSREDGGDWGGDGCGCLSYVGLLSGSCQRLDLYLEYPYRLVGGSPAAGSNLQTVILSTIVGRHT